MAQTGNGHQENILCHTEDVISTVAAKVIAHTFVMPPIPLKEDRQVLLILILTEGDQKKRGEKNPNKWLDLENNCHHIAFLS